LYGKGMANRKDTWKISKDAQSKPMLQRDQVLAVTKRNAKLMRI